MHEGAIVSSLFQTADDIRKKENLKEIHLIKVKIGKFHQIVPEVMQTYFKLMKKEYPGFNEAELILEEIDLKLRCKKCQHSYLLQEPLFICDQCGSWETELISGDELYIETIEGWQEDLDNSLTGEDQ